MVVRGSESKMLIFHSFFNVFVGFGIENVDFSFVFQWFFGVSVEFRFRARSPCAVPPRAPGGGFRDPFYHLKNPLAKRY